MSQSGFELLLDSKDLSIDIPDAKVRSLLLGVLRNVALHQI